MHVYKQQQSNPPILFRWTVRKKCYECSILRKWNETPFNCYYSVHLQNIQILISLIVGHLNTNMERIMQM